MSSSESEEEFEENEGLPDFTSIGMFLNMKLTPEEALDYVFWSPFKLIEEESEDDDTLSLDLNCLSKEQ